MGGRGLPARWVGWCCSGKGPGSPHLCHLLTASPVHTARGFLGGGCFVGRSLRGHSLPTPGCCPFCLHGLGVERVSSLLPFPAFAFSPFLLKLPTFAASSLQLSHRDGFFLLAPLPRLPPLTGQLTGVVPPGSVSTDGGWGEPCDLGGAHGQLFFLPHRALCSTSRGEAVASWTCWVCPSPP